MYVFQKSDRESTVSVAPAPGAACLQPSQKTTFTIPRPVGARVGRIDRKRYSLATMPICFSYLVLCTTEEP